MFNERSNESEFKSIFGHSTLIPMEEDQFNKNRTFVYEKLIQRINQIREAEKNTPSHLSHLPWEWWLLDLNFRKGIWEMQSFWQNHLKMLPKMTG